MTTSDFADVDLSKVDLTDLSYFEDGPPYQLFARMRGEASPHWNALTGDEPGFWSFTRAADIQAISRDPGTFSSARGGVFATSQGAVPPEVLGQVILGMDPPQHTKIRNIVQVTSIIFLLSVVGFVQIGFVALFFSFWRRARDLRRKRESFRLLEGGAR